MDGKELWATAQCRPTPRSHWTRRARATLSWAWPSARSARWWTSTSKSAPSAWSRWRWQDMGRVLNPAQLATRIEAGITQGVGTALTENLRTTRGLLRHPDLTGYALPTFLDAPDIRIVKLVEERDVVAPFGAKAAGAVPVVTSPAAVASAVRAATGRPVNRLPIRPQAAVAVTDL
ncbi:molybdopterin cofactor-binding domain-containing protein [Streptomyces sp. NPDC054802]